MLTKGNGGEKMKASHYRRERIERAMQRVQEHTEWQVRNGLISKDVAKGVEMALYQLKRELGWSPQEIYREVK